VSERSEDEQSEQQDFMQGMVLKMPKPGETFQVVLTGALADWFRNEVEARGMELGPVPTGEDDLPTVAVFPKTETT
jgi:hypothetical protein